MDGSSEGEDRHENERQPSDFAVDCGAAHPIDRVGARAGEAEIGCEGLAIDAEGVARERTRAERQLIHPLRDLSEPLPVTPPRCRVREHPVAPTDRLRRLQVCVAGHEDVRLGGGPARCCQH